MGRRVNSAALAAALAGASAAQAQPQGDFTRFTAYGEAGFGYDANPQQSARHREGDWFGVLAPTLRFEMGRERQRLEIEGYGELARYVSDTRHDYVDGGIRGEWFIQLADWATFRLKGGYGRDHLRLDLDIEDPMMIAEEATARLRGQAAGELRLRFDAWLIDGGVTFDDHDFIDGTSVLGPKIDYDYRDFHQIAPYASVGRDLGGGLEAYVLGRFDMREYWYSFGPGNRHSRNSQGVAGLLGLRYGDQQRDALSFSIAAGGQHQNFEDRFLPDVTTWIGEARLTWRPDRDLRVEASAERVIDESDRLATAAEINSRLKLNAEWRFAEAWSVEPQAEMFHQIPVSDGNPGEPGSRYELGLGLFHHLDEHHSIGISYAHSWGAMIADSALAGEVPSFDRDRAMIRFRMRR